MSVTFAGGNKLAAEDLSDVQDQIGGSVGCSYTTAGVLAVSTNAGGGVETAMAAWGGADQAFTFENGHVYAARTQCVVYNGAGTLATLERSQIRIRKAVNSTAAQVLGNCLATTFGTGTAGAQFANWSAYIVNSTGSDLTGVHLGLTIDRLSGANDNTLYGDPTFPTFIILEDVGLSSDNPNIVALAAAIT
jgi:hypothetical protein